MLKFGIFGFGQAGSNLAEYAITKGFKSVVANTAKVDLNLLKYIPPENRLLLGEYKGAGRNMEIGKAATVENADRILNFAKDKLSDCDIIFISGAGGGGTGAGALPVAIEILLEIGSIINVAFVIPDKTEPTAAQMNAYDCFARISDNLSLGSIFMVDNQQGKELHGNLPKFKVHQQSNKQLFDILSEINNFTDKTSYTNNFDDRDLLDILSTRGCTLISKSEFFMDRNVQDNDVSAFIQQSWKKTYSPEYDLNSIVKAAILGKMKNDFSNKVNIQQMFNGNVPYDIKDSLYQGTDDTATFYTMFSGLQFPNNRLQMMKAEIEKVEEDLIKRVDISQNQRIESVNWKLNAPKTEPLIIKEKSMSLSDKLKKFK